LKVSLSILLGQLLTVTADVDNHTGDLSRDLRATTLKVAGCCEISFGKPVRVRFEHPSPKPYLYPWIGIYKDLDEVDLNDISYQNLHSWTYTCGSQELDECEPQVDKGLLTFSAKDPREFDWNFESDLPFRPGKYRVCYINEVETGYDYDDYDYGYEDRIVTDCVRFRVREPIDKMIQKTKIVPKSLELHVGDAFVADFRTPINVPNQWVGLYPARDDGGPPQLNACESVLWTFTGCDNQSGDQETMNCANRKPNKKIGEIHMDEESLDNYGNCGYYDVAPQWPIGPGDYYMCLNFLSDKPYDIFTCSEKITVSHPEDSIESDDQF